MIFLWIAAVILILWILSGFITSRVEQAKYTVVGKKRGYEIRKYAPQLLAEVAVKGNYEEAINEGFRILAGYIFGENVSKRKIAMTAPVVERQGVSEKIAMTAPVLASLEKGHRVIAFGMPSGATMDNLPKPNNPQITFRMLNSRKVAVLRFSWFSGGQRVEAKKRQLLGMLNRDKVKTVSGPQYAGYNPPWTPPFMRRHEILVEIR
jgi:hypothetical protein